MEVQSILDEASETLRFRASSASVSRTTFVSSFHSSASRRERESSFEFSRAPVECHVSLGGQAAGGASGVNVTRRALRQCPASFRRVLLVSFVRVGFLSRATGGRESP